MCLHAKLSNAIIITFIGWGKKMWINNKYFYIKIWFQKWILHFMWPNCRLRCMWRIRGRKSIEIIFTEKCSDRSKNTYIKCMFFLYFSVHYVVIVAKSECIFTSVNGEKSNKYWLKIDLWYSSINMLKIKLKIWISAFSWIIYIFFRHAVCLWSILCNTTCAWNIFW